MRELEIQLFLLKITDFRMSKSEITKEIDDKKHVLLNTFIRQCTCLHMHPGQKEISLSSEQSDHKLSYLPFEALDI